MKNLSRKIRKTGRRMLRASRHTGRTISKGTGFARKIIGKVDSYTGGGATAALMSNPYSAAALTGLTTLDTAAKVLSNPKKSLATAAMTRMS